MFNTASFRIHTLTAPTTFCGASVSSYYGSVSVYISYNTKHVKDNGAESGNVSGSAGAHA